MSGVASRNPFALLGDADDVAAASAPAPKPAATPVAPVKAKPTPAPTAARTNNRSGGRGGARGGAASAPRGDAEGAAASEQKDVRTGSARGRGESRGRGGRGRGDRAPRGRAFDRHSQTGKEDTEKKIAQGWGAQDGETELAAEENGKADAETEVAEGAGAATPAANGAAAERPAPIPEEEDNTKTLDEYLAEQTAKRAQLGISKEGREVNQSAWDKLQATKVDKTKAEEDYFAAKEKASKGPRARKEKQYVEIDTRFETPSSARGGSERGGRGGGRGGSERGSRGGRGRGRGEGRGGPRGGRGGSGAAPQVNLADQSAFPSLA